MQQQNLFQLPKPSKAFGGSLQQRGKRKTARTLNSKLPIHLILRSEGNKLFKNLMWTEFYLEKFSHKFNIKIYRKAVCSNHIHVLIKIPNREQYNKFIRALSGALAKKLKIKWELLPYTRLLTWGREFKSVQGYVALNILEAFGAIKYQKRNLSGP